MHEITVIKKIVDVVLQAAKENKAQRVVSVTLEVGSLSDFQDIWMKKYYDDIVKGTIAENSKLIVHRLSAIGVCVKCGKEEPVNLKSSDILKCNDCDSELSIQADSSYVVKNIEIE